MKLQNAFGGVGLSLAGVSLWFCLAGCSSEPAASGPDASVSDASVSDAAPAEESGGSFFGQMLGLMPLDEPRAESATGPVDEPAFGGDSRDTLPMAGAAVETGRPPSYLASASDPVSTPGETINLLRQVDRWRDAAGPPWIQESDGVVSPRFPRSLLQIRYSPPAAYRWTVVAERIAGGDSLNLMFTIGGHRTMVVLDGFTDHSSGLNLLDGLRANENETTRRGAIFQQQRPYVFVCTVTPSSVQVTCDGTTIVQWSGDPSRLSLREEWVNLPPTTGLGLAVYDSRTQFRINRIELQSLEPGQAGVWNLAARSSPSMHGSSSGTSSSGPGLRTKPLEPSEAALQQKGSICLIEHPQGSGTGFVVGQGIIATNAHVVDGAFAEEIEVDFSTSGGGRHRVRKILYKDSARDLCLLQVPLDRPAIPIVADHAFERGENVVLIGNPAMGKTDVVLRDAVTTGTVAATVHTKGCTFYQIEARVNVGSSGGPVLNFDGQVIGVVAMKATDRGEMEIQRAMRELDHHFASRQRSPIGQGITFAIPVSDLNRAIQEVQRQSESAADRATDLHAAQVVMERLRMLGGLYLLELHANVRPEVRSTAHGIRTGRVKVPPATLRKMKLVELLPEHRARSLAVALRSEEVRQLIRNSSRGLDEKVGQLAANGHLDKTTADSLQSLLTAVNATKRSAENPTTSYQTFSQVVSTRQDQMQKLFDELSDQLAITGPAYED
jgi:serine protease Do